MGGLYDYNLVFTELPIANRVSVLAEGIPYGLTEEELTVYCGYVQPELQLNVWRFEDWLDLFYTSRTS